jgi:hypothetical protein
VKQRRSPGASRVVALAALLLTMASCSDRHDASFQGYWDEVRPALDSASVTIHQYVFHADGTLLHNVVTGAELSSESGSWKARRSDSNAWELTVLPLKPAANTPAIYRVAFENADRLSWWSASDSTTHVFARTPADTAFGFDIDTTSEPFPVVSLDARMDYEQALETLLTKRSLPADSVSDFRTIWTKVTGSWHLARQELSWARRFKREATANRQAADSLRTAGLIAQADSLFKQAEINADQGRYQVKQSYMYESIAEHNLRRCELVVPGTYALVRSARPLVKDTTRVPPGS